MTTTWRLEAEKELSRYGLRLLPVRQKPKAFKGLAGADAETKQAWRMPCGVYGAHTEITISEIEGDMPTLLSRSDLERWG